VDILSFIRAKHNLVFKLLIVTVCSFVLALLLPDKEILGHRVDSLTTIWPYPDIILSQDFVIRKTDQEIAEERKQIELTAPLFFESRDDEKARIYSTLENMRTKDEKFFFLVKPLLDSIYERGIIEDVGDFTSGRPVYIVNGNFAEGASRADFFTITTAHELLRSALQRAGIDGSHPELLAITLFYNKQKTSRFLISRMEHVSMFKSVLKAGQPLVRQGESLNDNKRFFINRYYYQMNRDDRFTAARFVAKWGLTFLMSLVLLVFIAFFRKPIFGQNRQLAFLYLLLLLTVTVTYFFHRYGLVVLMIPFTLVPILVRVFFDGRTALFTHLMIILHCSFFMPDKLQFILLELLPGIGTLFAVAEMRKRQQILNAAALVFLFYVFIFLTYQYGFGAKETVTRISSFVPFGVSSMLVLLAYPLIYLTEKFFGFISDFKLLELCDLNHPLLRKLSKEVPGTFQHSLQVANLAEEAIFYIGGNSLLVRAGAMYHDIGKIENPTYFTENQANGFSPHLEIEPIESARIIINHVIIGVELAKKYKLPEQIIDFIRTHHGTTSVRYFLNLFRQRGNESRIAESQFRYPGPIPFSKETAVLMIADGVEAASRSLKNHDAVAINDLVDNIIDYKIANNQFINSDITFKDITTIKKIFKKRLMNIYHARIEYPA
jgi:cyclic-di-AMP phosphodiesterase PgpH